MAVGPFFRPLASHRPPKSDAVRHHGLFALAALVLPSMAAASSASFVAGTSHGMLDSPDGVAWSGGGEYMLTAVDWSGKEWVAVGTGGTILRSADGLQWTLQASGGTDLLGVAWGVSASGTGRWLAVGTSGAAPSTTAYMRTSTDGGLTWTTVCPGGPDCPDGGLAAIAYAKVTQRWVAIGTGAGAFSSSDGLTWTKEASGSGPYLAVASDGVQFVAVGSEGSVALRTPSGTWVAQDVPTAGNLYSVDYAGDPSGAGLWVAVGYGGHNAKDQLGTNVLTSTDGMTWGLPQSPGASLGSAVAGDGQDWIMGSTGGSFFLRGSGSPLAWKPEDSLSCGTIHALRWGGARWVAVGGDVISKVAQRHVLMSSTDGVAWVSEGCGSARSVATDGATWVAVGGTVSYAADGSVRASFETSTDGRQWRRVEPAGGRLDGLYAMTNGVAWNPARGEFAAVTSCCLAWTGNRWTFAHFGNPLALTSSDGQAWAVQPMQGDKDMMALASDGSQWVAVGKAGTVETSPDGLQWTQRCPAPPGDGTGCGPDDLNGVATDGRTWVAVGQKVISTSTDGIHWTAQQASTPLLSVATDGTTWTAVGAAGTALTWDGVAPTWTAVPVPPGTLHLRGVATDGEAWVAVGDNGGILDRSQGQPWTAAASGWTTAYDSLQAVASSVPRLVCVLSAAGPFQAGQAVTFEAFGGQAPYQWTVDGEPAGAGPSHTETWSAPGTHEVAVAGALAAHCPSVTVVPKALACLPASIQLFPGQVQTFVASGGIGPYAWTEDGAPAQGGASLEAAFDATGPHPVEVSDAEATPQSCSCLVEVVQVPPPPVPPPPPPPAVTPASAPHPKAPTTGPPGYAPPAGPPAPQAEEGTAARAVTVEPSVAASRAPAPVREASGPSDPQVPLGFDAHAAAPLRMRFESDRGAADGSFGWEFGDGSSAVGTASPMHTYTHAGTYLVRLSFIGKGGRLEMARRTVTVDGPPALQAAVVASAPPSAPWPLGLAAAAGALAIAWVLLRYAWPNFALVFFSRLRQSDLARHPVRAAILDVLGSQPGIRKGELARLTGKDRKTVDYHLAILCAAGLVRKRRWGNSAGYSLAPARDDGAAGHVDLAGAPKAKALLRIVEEEPGIAYMELVRKSGLRKSTLRYHLAELARTGLVAFRRDGNRLRLYGARQP